MATYGAAWTKMRNQRIKQAALNDEPCCRCGSQIDYTLKGNSRYGPTLDHLHPLSRGGELLAEPDLLAPAHNHCNSRHGGRIGNRSPTRKGKAKKEMQTANPISFGAPREPSPAVSHNLSPITSDVRTPFTRNPRNRPDNAALPLMFSGPHLEAVGSYGDMAVEWIEARMAADPNAEGDGLWWHQWLVFQRALEHRADGSLCWPLVLFEAPRQQAKTVTLAELALWRSGHPDLFGEEQRVLHAARVASLADQVQGRAHMWAEDIGLKVSRRKADSYITWPDGSYWHVMALSAVWGQRVGMALLDEGWDMSPAAFWSGLWPAMAQRRMRQAWVFSASNVGDRGLLASLRKLKQTLVIFWGAPVGADVMDEAVWHAATPFMTPERLEGMRIASEAPGFAVEWLNMAPDTGVQPAVLWGADLVGGLPGRSDRPWAAPLVLAVESDFDGKSWGAAASDGTHVVCVQVPRRSDAIAWLLGHTANAVVLLAHDAVVKLLPQDFPLPVEKVSTAAARSATSLFKDAVRSGNMSWDGVLAEQLKVADVSGGRGMEHVDAARSRGSVSALKAATWALWRAATQPAVAPAVW